MTDREALLAAVVADPDADLPRLAFADWCDEAGDPDRAELVRAQCAAARLSEADPNRHGFAARVYILADRGAEQWLAELPTPAGAEWLPAPNGLRSRDTFDRGFPSRLRVVPDVLLEHAGRLFAASPVRHLTVAGELRADHLAAIPTPRTLWVLRLDAVAAPAARGLASAPALASLRELHVAGDELATADRDRLRTRFGDRLWVGGARVTTRRRRRR